mmetsp:Transcript_5033/g.12967  ORF Transcript_5033/g.12967 Transcript_5033/m.12967 type:complete len:1111 (+) Transcript_5033:61-3393(+)
MEVTLDGSEGVPEGAVLSIKFGDTKRQAPVAKVGQPFRFPGSPADPLPLKVELLVPVAPAQTVEFDAVVERFSVDFGNGTKVNLSQREIVDSQRASVDISKAAEARGLQAEKLAMAQKAANYLEEHDLVRMFQDILHGLLMAKPQDPHGYIEERLARARKLSAKHGVTASACGADADTASQRSGGMSVRECMRTSTSLNGYAKVETLMQTLQNTHSQLPVVLPFLPPELRTDLGSEELAEECRRQFQQLDTEGKGSLTPAEMLPVITRLSQVKQTNVSDDQIKRFVGMFDANQDGVICQAEFTALVQFVIVSGFLESEDGKATLEIASIEESAFQDFITMVEEDKERLWSIIPFLPTWLMEHVTSEEFQRSCIANFVALDADASGSLEPEELLDVIAQLSEAHPLAIDLEKCKRFTKVFDTAGNGVILRDEFIEFAQFLTVMNYLAGSAEGQQIKQLSEADAAAAKTIKLIRQLELSGTLTAEVLAELPKALVRKLKGKAFAAACDAGFVREAARGDAAEKQTLTSQELYPVVCDLVKVHPFDVIREQYGDFVAVYCQAKAKPQNMAEFKAENGAPTISELTKEQFPDLARFVIVMAYLNYAQEHQEMLFTEMLLGQEKVSQLLASLRDGVDRITEFAPFLPQALVDEILSDAFAEQCKEDFVTLDQNKSGVLEPNEIMPLIQSMTTAHHLSLTEAHCRHFVEIFDVDQNGVITQAEFVNFARFMMIMAFLDTPEGIAVEVDAEVAKQTESVEELLQMLESDRNAVHKVIPFLPKDVYENLTSDEFVMNCHQRFVELDKDKTGVLRPWELFPVVVDLSAASPCAVTDEQCKRFTAIFDLHGDGVLRLDEFLDFTRFLCIMSYLHADEGKDAAKGALDIMRQSKEVEELLQTMEKDKNEMHKVIPFLPGWLRDDLLSDHFTVECLTFFKELDKDGNGSLDATELYPMVLALSEAQEAALDIEQCKHFMAIFDDEKTGVISVDEFVNFARFMIIMGYLKGNQDVPSVMRLDEAAQGDTQAAGEDTMLAVTSPSMLLEHVAPNSPAHLVPAHLAVDCEYYRDKSDKLTSENETLRGRLHSLEDLVRAMEKKLDDQGQRLRHAEVDLRASGALR